MRNIYLVLISCTLFLGACSTDLTVIDDYKDIAIVYGLLNQNDTAQYIKINKAFLGAGNALQMATVYDSVTYKNLRVELERWKNGSKVGASIKLNPDFSIPKPSGTFSSPLQMLYKTKSPLFEDSEYKLVITDTIKGNVVRGSTAMVQSIASLSKPFSSTFNFTNKTIPFKIEWVSVPNGKMYGVTLRFYYIEKNVTTSQIDSSKYVDWVFANQNSQTTLGGQAMSVEFLGNDFFGFLKSQLAPPASNIQRYVKNVSAHHFDIIFTVGTEDLATYISVSQPATGLLQEKPQYTNLDNGYGVFAARYTKVFDGINSNNYMLGSFSLDSLYTGSRSGNLFFDISGVYE